MRSCLSLCQKSTLMPLTPHDLILRISDRRTIGSDIRSRGASVTSLCGPPELYHSIRPMFFSRACAATCSIVPPVIMVQFASTSEYSQPMSAAKSVYAFSRGADLGLLLSDHQLHADRPGTIHVVSFKWAADARSFTRSDSRMRPAVSPMMATRQGNVHGRPDRGAALPTPMPSAESGNLIRYTPSGAFCCR